MRSFVNWLKRIFNPRKVMKEVITSMDFETGPDLASMTFDRDGRLYKFICLKTAPLGEVYDAVTSMKSHVIEAMKKAENPEKKEE